MPTTEDQVRAALAGVKDPEIRRPITDLGMVKGVAVDPDGRVTVQVWLTVAGCPLRETITRDVTAAVAPLPGVADVRVELEVMSDTQRRQLQDTLRGGTAANEIPFAKTSTLNRAYAEAPAQGGVDKCAA